MSEGRILVVEDEFDTAEMLRIYFSGEGYQVETADRGPMALELVRHEMPDLIILDIMLPGMDGYEICRKLRINSRTSHIPIIFLTQKDEKSDVIAGLELGADDYITKPFDFEELRLRVKNAITAHRRLNLSDPRTGLPASRLIEDQLRQLVPKANWTYVDIEINHLAPFDQAHGFVATDEVLRFAALLISEVVNKMGTPQDFVGHAGNSSFVLITFSNEDQAMIDTIRKRFSEGVITHYNFLDSEQGGIRQPDGSLAPIMNLSFGVVTSKNRQFTDIREITETAAENRRLSKSSSD